MQPCDFQSFPVIRLLFGRELDVAGMLACGLGNRLEELSGTEQRIRG